MTYTFDWSGYGIDGPGADLFLNSNLYRTILNDLRITPVHGSEFHSINATWIGSLGKDIPGTKNGEVFNNIYSSSDQVLKFNDSTLPFYNIASGLSEGLDAFMHTHNITNINKSIKEGFYTFNISSIPSNLNYQTFLTDKIIVTAKINSSTKIFTATNENEGLRIIEKNDSSEVIVQRLNKHLEATETFDVYTVKSGDTLSDIAKKMGTTINILIKFNTDISDPDKIYAGEKIYVPYSVQNNASSAPDVSSISPNQFFVDNIFIDLETISFVTGISVDKLIAANPALSDKICIAPGTLVNLPSAINSFTLDITPDPDTQENVAEDPTDAVNIDHSTLFDNGISQIEGIGNVNTADGNTAYANAIISDGFMPGANQLWSAGTLFNENLGYANTSDNASLGAFTNQQASGSAQWIPVDPLVLDLNGTG